jgi:hypothetical protein
MDDGIGVTRNAKTDQRAAPSQHGMSSSPRRLGCIVPHMHDARASAARAGLYGRERELEALRDAFARARAGEASIALVVGEPGIGKSRLLQTFADEAAASGAAVAWGRAWEAGGAPPFWPWLEALRGLLERVDLGALALGAARLEALGQLVPEVSPAAAALPALEPEAARFRLFEAVGALLRAAARARAVLLVLDDLHAADLSSLALLHFVARNVRDAQLTVIGAYRDVEARLSEPVLEVLARVAREGRYLALSRLSQQDVQVWLESLSLPSALHSTLWERTEGNPLFILETLRLWRGHGMREPSRAVPELAREVLRARLSELSPAVLTLLEAAAVFGRRCALEEAAAVAGLDPIAAREALAEAVRNDVLAVPGSERIEFTHILLRDALYEALPAARRSELHAAALGVLGPHGPALTPGSLAAAVHHAFAAIPRLPVTEAVAWARAAAARAIGELAYDAAADWLERAVVSLPLAPELDRERCELLLASAEAEVGAGRTAKSLESSRMAAALARKLGDRERVAEAALSYGRVYTLATVPAELVALLEEALAALPREDGPQRARLLARLASALQPARDPEPPMALARDAIAMARRLADPRTELEVLAASGSALGYFAQPAERADSARDLISLADRLGDRARGLRGRARLAMDLLEQGQIASAEAHVQEQERLASTIDLPSFGWLASALGATIATVRGRFSEAEEKLERARALAARIDDANASLTLTLQRVALLRAAERRDELRSVAPAAIERVFSVADLWYARAFAASVNASAGLLVEARVMLAAVLQDLEPMRSRPALTWVAEACVATADVSLAGHIFEPLSRFSNRNHCWGMKALVCEGPITLALGRLAALLDRHDEALRLLNEARARAETMQAQPWRERIELEIAALRSAGSGRSASAPAPRATGTESVSGITVQGFSMQREGDVWAIRGSAEIRLKDSRGLRILAHLLEHPGREFHVTELLAPPGEAGYAADAGEVLDAVSVARYRQRLEDLREQEREAAQFADLARAERLRAEMDALSDELARAVGLGGRARRAGSTAEKARVNVRQRLRDAIEKVAQHDPPLGQHLRWAVRTGNFCRYDPKQR